MAVYGLLPRLLCREIKKLNLLILGFTLHLNQLISCR